MDPINYTLQAANPAQAILQGVQGGLGIQQAQIQQQQQQLQLAQQQQMQSDLASFAAKPNPSADDYRQIMTRYPQLADKFKQSYDVMNTGQQQAQLQALTPVYAALRTGNNDAANQVLDQQIAAYENSGNAQGVQGARTMKQWIATSPSTAMHVIGMQMAATQPEKFSDIVSSLSSSGRSDATLPADMQKGQADASKATTEAATAAATAPYAAPQAQANVQKTQQETAASELQGQIGQKNLEIAQANSETERGKLTLERDKLLQAQQQQQNTQGQATQASMDAATRALDTLDQIKTHPGMRDNLAQQLFLLPTSTKPGTLWGKVYGNMPGSDRNALNGWIDSLRGQLGFQNLMAAKAANPNGASGFGSLSEGELKLLSNLAGNLDPNSSDFPKQLGQVEKFLQKTQATLVGKTGQASLPSTGGAFVANSPKYGVITEGRINALLQQNPGATRDDVLRFLGVGQ